MKAKMTHTGIVAASLLALSIGAYADPPTTMAPPIQPSTAQTADAPIAGNDQTTGASQDSVFNWSEVPANQQVPIRRAVFDRGGYQLYDTVGETIVVPFANQNLYVMKFAVSDDGTTYFVNTGSAPVLYLPKHGYLENASVSGAKWYPFSDDFHPAQPVFLGIAPSYTAFIGMGWYPDMFCYGGYYGYHPFLAGGVFLPTLGLAFFIGGHPYYGWGPYHRYYFAHPAPYRVGFVNRNIYHFGGRSFGTFRGAGHSFVANRAFNGSGHAFNGAHAFGGSGHTFNGARGFNGSGHTLYAHRAFSGSRTFMGARAGSAGHAFAARSGGGHSFSEGHSGGGHAFGGDHAGGGGHMGGGDHAGGGHDGRH